MYALLQSEKYTYKFARRLYPFTWIVALVNTFLVQVGTWSTWLTNLLWQNLACFMTTDKTFDNLLNMQTLGPIVEEILALQTRLNYCFE